MVNAPRFTIGSASKLFSALSDPVRLRILMFLAAHDLCVCEIARLMEIPQPTLSNHLRVLKEAGLVIPEIKGRWRLYRLGRIPGPLKNLLAELLEDENVKSDLEKLRKYLTESRIFCEGTRSR
ncbi:MAG: metalloregulator ArsR/SmtB family transcription factor [candidate division WOR-3 bacterium]